MALEDRFNYLVLEWKKFIMEGNGSSGVPVRVSSRAEDVADCEAYNEIARIGKRAIPLIRRLYDLDDSQDFPLSVIKSHGLVMLVRQIAGSDFSIPEEIRGRIDEMAKYTKQWIDRHKSKFYPLREGMQF